MTTLLIVTLFLVAALAAWAWFRRRHTAEQSREHVPLAAERSATVELQSTAVTEVAVTTVALRNEKREPLPDANLLEATADSASASFEPEPRVTEATSVTSQAIDVRRPEMELQPAPDLTPAIIQAPAIPPATPPDAPLPATTKATSIENTATVHECEDVKSTLVHKRLVSIGGEETGKPWNFLQHEPLAMETKTPTPISEANVPASESATQPAIADKKVVELETPEGATIASTYNVPPRGNGKVESEARPTLDVALTEAEQTPKSPTYHPPTPPATTLKTSGTRERAPHSMPTADANLRLRIQLVFGRDGTVKTLALVADLREGMPSDIELTGTQGELRLTELRDDCYDPVPLPDAANALRQGIEWRGRGDARRWRWVLGGRPLFVFAQGDEFGLHGFVSTTRLWLNAHHAILATANLRDEVVAALANSGCANPEISDEETPGVPSSWILFRNVTPTRAVPMRDEQDILNVLCPAHDIEPHFVGGIRLERKTWLAGFPPRIRLTGELGSGFQVMIDGQLAHPVADGAFETPGWDAEGDHRLWFGDRAETYSLCTMDESWDGWPAHDFRTGTAICGAGIHQTEEARCHQVRVSTSNPLLVGARPGEIFCYQAHHDVRSETISVLVPFAPVWALPTDPLHANKRLTRIILLNAAQPIAVAEHANQSRNTERALRKWIIAINDARHKRLALAEDAEEANALWRHYCAVAKHLWRRMR